ncbi:protein of unknown function [Methylocella tundrae]|uniref:HTH arsR-type domain-containing protein n=1 Tax=Methylocella tundrae TaxID=227605 RepID=A0A4U8YZF9_METTU|nr:protein of unknown function [Methylocella tundrae]
MPQSQHAPFDVILNGLTAAGEATRLRLLALLAEAELTVSELVTILGAIPAARFASFEAARGSRTCRASP